MFFMGREKAALSQTTAGANHVQLIEIEKIVSPKYDMSNERDRRLSSDEICEMREKFNKMRVDYDEA